MQKQNRRVLVVGTTSDYIDIISRRYPGRALFITGETERAEADEPAPGPTDELLCDLARPQEVLSMLRQSLERWNIQPSGVACFDCESLSLAAFLADAFALPYPSAEAITACRSKFLSKQMWQQAQLPCPATALVSSDTDTIGFFRSIERPVVLKPLTGSGSELIFLCNSERDCATAFAELRSGLAHHPDQRMYTSSAQADPRRAFVIEEFVDGTEYSCDFLIEAGRVEVLRIAQKVPARNLPLGATLAYIVPGQLPPGIHPQAFRDQLREAAHAVGLTRAICMLDFIVRDNEAVMIEIAPRPGGDCLPPLLEESCGLQMLGAVLDFAEGRPLDLPRPEAFRKVVGLHLFATRAGIIDRLDASALLADQRVLECHLKHGPGHRVVLPPADYSSRLLGHAIFVPSPGAGIEAECSEIAAELVIEMRAEPCATQTTP